MKITVCCVNRFLWLMGGTLFYTLHMGVSFAKGLYLSVAVGECYALYHILFVDVVAQGMEFSGGPWRVTP